MNKKKVLVIVAHPDDEIIWAGGTIIRNTLEKPNWDLTIISLCRADDKDRGPRFRKVCKILNAKGFISDLEDEKLNPINLSEIKSRILNFAEKSYDIVLTHGENGEYGHIRHEEIHGAVKEILKDKSISSKKVFFFAYQKKISKDTDTGFDCYANENANKFINLINFEILKKKDLIQEIYGFQKGSFEERSCRDKEAFVIN